uniref:Uncharacterized protein n=1 Tax=Piliocolobus tephrosceles TaxID=591936 RepID=A0A8C9H1F8_9PRIM
VLPQEKVWKLHASSHIPYPIHLFIWCSLILFVISLIVKRVEEEENHHIPYLEFLQKGHSEFHV